MMAGFRETMHVEKKDRKGRRLNVYNGDLEKESDCVGLENTHQHPTSRSFQFYQRASLGLYQGHALDNIREFMWKRSSVSGGWNRWEHGSILA